MQYIGYNMNSSVFSNYGLRGAITFAIDREQLVEQTLGGFAAASTLPCSPKSRYYDVKLANSFAYDTGSYYDQLASASVEDATGDGILDLYVPSKGYSVPVEGTMIVCSSSYIRVQAATEVARMLNDLGFNITVKSMEYTEYKNALLQGNFDLYYGEVRLSPNFDLSPFFGATGTLNYGSLSDSTMMNLCSMALVNSGKLDELNNEELLHVATLIEDNAVKAKVLEYAAKKYDDSRAYTNLGAAYLQMGDADKALAALTQAVKLGGNTQELNSNLALANLAAGNVDEAKKYAAAADAQTKSLIAAAQGQYGDAAAKLKGYNAAVAAVMNNDLSAAKKALAGENSADADYLRAVIATKEGDMKTAGAQLKAAVAKDSALAKKASKDVNLKPLFKSGFKF